MTRRRFLFFGAKYDPGANLADALCYDIDSHTALHVLDSTGHRPCGFVDMAPGDISVALAANPVLGNLSFDEVSKFDAIEDRQRLLTKVEGVSPTDVGGAGSFSTGLGPSASDMLFENDIRYHIRYMADRRLRPGMYYTIVDGVLERIDDFKPSSDLMDEVVGRFVKSGARPEVIDNLRNEFATFFTPLPKVYRLALDIEVLPEGKDRFPSPDDAKQPIISLAVKDNFGMKLVMILKRPDAEVGEPREEMKDIVVMWFDREKDMVLELFDLLNRVPVLVTYSGDEFDLKYIRNRAKRSLGIPVEDIPIAVKSGNYGTECFINNGIHIDLFKVFDNNALHTYAFGGTKAYPNTPKLEHVAMARLGRGKVGSGEGVEALTLWDLAWYNWNDAEITLELTTDSDDLVMSLMFLLARMTCLPVEEVSRRALTAYATGMFKTYMIQNNILIPNSDQLRTKGGASTESVGGKKYEGARIIEPIPGVFFKVVVLDFASLYPSLIDRYNVSFDTINCLHEECRENTVPGTKNWICTKRVGVATVLIGTLRGLRLLWFKSIAKRYEKKMSDEERDRLAELGVTGDVVRKFYKVFESVLKVFMNGSYGVIGEEKFSLYCPPAAESITALGRYAIDKLKEEAEGMGIIVIYGDTDSTFLHEPRDEDIRSLIEWSERELDVDLEVDKEFRYLVISKRKKNYLGVYEDGSTSITGLTGKKSNTPKFVQDEFYSEVDMLSKVVNQDVLEEVRGKIRKSYARCIHRLTSARDRFPINELVVSVSLKRSIDSYGKKDGSNNRKKGLPQHVKVAKMLRDHMGVDVPAGTMVRMIKTKGSTSAKPVEMISGWTEVDIKKYKELLKNTMIQILDPLDIDPDGASGSLASFLKKSA